MTIEIPIEQIPARYLHIEITGPDSYFGTMKLQKVENKLKTPSADDEQERTLIKLMYTIIDKDTDTKLNNVTKLYFSR